MIEFITKWFIYIFIGTVVMILLSLFIFYNTTTNLIDDPVFRLLLKKHGLDSIYKNKSGYFLLDKKIGKHETGYGEITCVGMESICDVLEYHKFDLKDTIFIDFGCGIGKSLVMAKLLGFKKAVGVEIVKQRCNIAWSVIQNLPDYLKQDIEIYNADMLNFSLEKILDGSTKPVVIFASNLLWSPDVIKDFYAKYMRETPEGSMIVASRCFVHPGDEKFIVSKNEYSVPMSWSKFDTCIFALLR